jgi:hypothetical protein
LNIGLYWALWSMVELHVLQISGSPCVVIAFMLSVMGAAPQ